MCAKVCVLMLTLTLKLSEPNGEGESMFTY